MAKCKAKPPSARILGWMFKINASLPQATKIISRTRFMGQFHIYIFNWEQKSPMFTKIKCNQRGNSPLTWGMEGNGVYQLHCFSASLASLLTQHVACFFHQSHWDLTGNYPVHRAALWMLLSCSVSIHSSKSFSQILPHWPTVWYHPKGDNTRVFPTPVRQSSRLWSRVHYTDQQNLFFWTQTIIKCPQ